MAIKRGGKELSAREQKALVMREAGWSSKEYQKRYDVLRNRARNYERAVGLEKGTINVADLLARDVHYRYRAEKEGYSYKPTEIFKAVSQTVASSPSRVLSANAIGRATSLEVDRIQRQFRGVIEKSMYSEQIANKVSQAMQNGTFSVSWYRELVESYARLLGGAKATLAIINKSISDRSKKIEWHS